MFYTALPLCHVKMLSIKTISYAYIYIYTHTYILGVNGHAEEAI